MTVDAVKCELNYLRECVQMHSDTKAVSDLKEIYISLFSELPDEYKTIMREKFINGKSNAGGAEQSAYSKITILKRTKKAIEIIAQKRLAN